MFWWYIGAAVFGFMFGMGAGSVVIRIIMGEWPWKPIWGMLRQK